MADIIRGYPDSPFLTPPQDALVVHLRVGDVWEDDPQWNKNGNPFYQVPVSYFEDRMPLYPSDVRRAVLVGGAWVPSPTYPRSSAYIDRVAAAFTAHGYEVELRLGAAPDDDIIYMGRAKHFVQTGGGFSFMLAQTVIWMGGQVFCYPPQREEDWDRFPCPGDERDDNGDDD